MRTALLAFLVRPAGLRRLSALPATAALLAAAAAAAQEPPRDPHAVQPERPTVATHAYTVAPGWAEIEAGVELDQYPDRSRGATAPIVVKIGLAHGVQLELDGAVWQPPQGGTTGIGDLAIGLKCRVLDKVPVLGDLSVQPSLKLPTAPTASGLGTGTTDVGLLLISSHQLGPISMDLNLGYTRRSGPGTRAPRNASLWTASFGGPATGALGWTAELYGYPGMAGPAGQAPIVALLAGPTLLVRSWLALDAGVIVPVTGPQPRALYAGGVVNVGRVW